MDQFHKYLVGAFVFLFLTTIAFVLADRHFKFEGLDEICTILRELIKIRKTQLKETPSTARNFFTPKAASSNLDS